MNRKEASLIADLYIEKVFEDEDFEVGINHKITEEIGLGYVFFYNAKEFYTTGLSMNLLAGNGHLLVLRDGRGIIHLPSSQSYERSVEQLENAAMDSEGWWSRVAPLP